MEMMMRQQRIWRSSKCQLHDMIMTLSVSTTVSHVQCPAVIVPEKLLRFSVALQCTWLLE